MVYKTSRLESSLDYADKTQLATTTQRRFECSRIVLFRVLLDHRVREKMTKATTKIPFVVAPRRVLYRFYYESVSRRVYYIIYSTRRLTVNYCILLYNDRCVMFRNGFVFFFL